MNTTALMRIISGEVRATVAAHGNVVEDSWTSSLQKRLVGALKATFEQAAKDTLDAAMRENERLRNEIPYAEQLRVAAERMVQAYRDWMAGCDNGTRWKDVEAAHINLRDALAKTSPEIGTQCDTTAQPGTTSTIAGTSSPVGAAAEQASSILSENWHAIEGSNGQCACGPEKGRCGDRLAAFIESIRPNPVLAVGHVSVPASWVRDAATFVRANGKRAGAPDLIREVCDNLADQLEALPGVLRGTPSQTGEIARWMMQHGYATGHGDGVDDLLTHLVDEVKTRLSQVRVEKEADRG